jgi:hypothetical protein
MLGRAVLQSLSDGTRRTILDRVQQPLRTERWRWIAAHLHVVGNLAWEIGAESGLAQMMKDGSTKRRVDWFVTNV